MTKNVQNRDFLRSYLAMVGVSRMENIFLSNFGAVSLTIVGTRTRRHHLMKDFREKHGFWAFRVVSR